MALARPDAAILQRLVRRNHERTREEQAGRICSLRPACQAPGTEQAKISLPVEAAFPANGRSTPETEGIAPQPWPTELAQQMQALCDALQQAAHPP